MVDYFLPWPQSALEGVARSAIDQFEDVKLGTKLQPPLAFHMAQTHSSVVHLCTEYRSKMQRCTYQTPKTFISYLALYKDLFLQKRAEVATKEARVKLGLAKLKQGSKDVETMRVELVGQEESLLASNQECSKMLSSLQVS